MHYLYSSSVGSILSKMCTQEDVPNANNVDYFAKFGCEGDCLFDRDRMTEIASSPSRLFVIHSLDPTTRHIYTQFSSSFPIDDHSISIYMCVSRSTLTVEAMKNLTLLICTLGPRLTYVPALNSATHVRNFHTHIAFRFALLYEIYIRVDGTCFITRQPHAGRYVQKLED
ncbi:unnamed protein product [Trichogramma brassicae]|uniref:Uncharacterized protein n=1 Tax=Trichogramma brassicae TaxID=86971 RepID=A0A6H5J407_9HYME|nr:unnamed protein product [Trichogramma brassicae]